jgi:hypothetical protein
MATHDYVIDNSTGANVRADINSVLQAILTNNSSSSAPSTTAAYMFWADTTNGVLKIRNSANNAWVELLQLDGTLTLEDGSASTPALAFRDDLDTGIFSSGANSLDIAASGSVIANFTSSGLSVTGAITATSDVTIPDKLVHSGDTNTSLRFPAADTISLETAGSEAARFDSSQRLLIGTTTNTFTSVGSSRLQVSGTGADTSGINLIRTDNSTGGAYLQFTKNRGSATQSGDNCGAIAWMGHDGTDVESYLAQIRVLAGATATSNTMTGDILFETANGSSVTSERMRIDSAGSLFHGCTSSPDSSDPGSAFIADSNQGQVRVATNSSATAVLVDFFNAHGNVGSIRTSGNNTSYNTSSDYRLKENAVAISDAITRLKTLKPYRFNFKNDPTKTVDGFFAHEVTAVPEAITGTKDEIAIEDNDLFGIKKDDPIYQGIDQSKLVPLLTAALQEAVAKIETLETKVAALEAA